MPKQFYIKWSFSKWPEKLVSFSGCFCKQIGYQELSISAQSGHTDAKENRYIFDKSKIKYFVKL